MNAMFTFVVVVVVVLVEIAMNARKIDTIKGIISVNGVSVDKYTS